MGIEPMSKTLTNNTFVYAIWHFEVAQLIGFLAAPPIFLKKIGKSLYELSEPQALAPYRDYCFARNLAYAAN